MSHPTVLTEEEAEINALFPVQPVAAEHECWSVDVETFRSESLGDLIDRHSGELEVGQTVYVGQSVRPDPARYVDADTVIEQMGELAYDDCSESAEDFPDVTKEARQELEDLLKAWATKHCTVTFWQVLNVREYVLTAEDLA
jgi:hypothetical protein